MQLITCLNASLLMAFRVIALALGGVMLVKRNIIDKNTSRNIGKVLSDFLMPCLIFDKIVTNFNITQYEIWVPVALLTFFCVFCGLIVGFLLAKFCFRYTKSSQKRLLSVITGFTQAGSIQLTMMITIAPTLDQIKPRNPDVSYASAPSERAIMYVMLTWVLIVSIRWSVGYALLAPDQEDFQPQKKIRKSTGAELDEIQVPLLEQDNNQQQLDNQPVRERHQMTCKDKCAKTLNVPIIFSIISLILASIPPVKNLFIVGGIFNSTIMATCRFIGQGYYILMIILMGANLTIFKADKLELSTSAHLMAVIFKLLIYPWIGVAIVIPLYYGKVLNDPMMVFVILILFAAPPANNLMIMASLHKNFEGDLAKSLLIAYCSSIFTLTGFSAFFLFLL